MRWKTAADEISKTLRDGLSAIMIVQPIGDQRISASLPVQNR